MFDRLTFGRSHHQILTILIIFAAFLLSFSCLANEVFSKLLGSYEIDFELISSFKSEEEQVKSKLELSKATVKDAEQDAFRIECLTKDKCSLTQGMFSNLNGQGNLSVLKLERNSDRLIKALMAAKDADYKPFKDEDLRVFNQVSLENCYISRSPTWWHGICTFKSATGATSFALALPDMSTTSSCTSDVCLIPVKKIK